VIQNLDLAPIGNSSISALIDRRGRFVWCCAPRVDSDPLFSSLLAVEDDSQTDARGFWSVEVENEATVEQAYLRNTPILRTVITDHKGASLEVLDFAPRFRRFGRGYRPTAFIRVLRPIRGAPRVTIRLRPTADWGGARATMTSGSNHIRYAGSDVTLRLTTNLPVSHIVSERTFRLEGPAALFLGPDEPFQGEVLSTANAMLAARLPYLLASCRFAQYLKCMVRDKVGSTLSRAQLTEWLQSWLLDYIDGSPSTSSEEWKAAHPLAGAEVVLEERDGAPGQYEARFLLQPHYQLEGVSVALRLMSRLST